MEDEKHVASTDNGHLAPEFDPEAKPHTLKDHIRGRQFSVGGEADPLVVEDSHQLQRKLQGRHMQMIAIGGAIGAGLFVNSGAAFASGGPGSVLVCFIIIGGMLLFVMQSMAELACIYPANGAFFTYIVRFVDPSWGFACGWDYAIQWLTILPYEITAASLTIRYWEDQSKDFINVGVWTTVFLVVLSIIQIFGVRGYGEVEFVLSIIKVIACSGFIIFGIIVNCGGVPTDHRGYIGARYWNAPYQPFVGGFAGFCSVFVVASFAFSGTELTALAAAESSNPAKQIPKAVRQVFWRIAFFYIVNLFIVGLIVPATNPHLLSAGASTTKFSPFVIAIKLAGVPVLPSIFNAVITISVISVANSATYGSTRTLQALALYGMAPKLFAYVGKEGRPIPTVILQLLFGCLAYINESSSQGLTIFYWLLALSGLGSFFVWGSTCLAHIRFRMAWKYNGHSVDELPYKAGFGVTGAWIGLLLNVLVIIAQFYYALWPGGVLSGIRHFMLYYLAAVLCLFLYLVWKIYSFFAIPAHRPFYVKIKDIDIYAGMSAEQLAVSGPNVGEEARRQSVAANVVENKTQWYLMPYRAIRMLI